MNSLCTEIRTEISYLKENAAYLGRYDMVALWKKKWSIRIKVESLSKSDPTFQQAQNLFDEFKIRANQIQNKVIEEIAPMASTEAQKKSARAALCGLGLIREGFPKSGPLSQAECNNARHIANFFSSRLGENPVLNAHLRSVLRDGVKLAEQYTNPS